jgi:hypothetical protein
MSKAFGFNLPLQHFKFDVRILAFAILVTVSSSRACVLLTYMAMNIPFTCFVPFTMTFANQYSCLTQTLLFFQGSITAQKRGSMT